MFLGIYMMERANQMQSPGDEMQWDICMSQPYPLITFLSAYDLISFLLLVLNATHRRHTHIK